MTETQMPSTVWKRIGVFAALLIVLTLLMMQWTSRWLVVKGASANTPKQGIVSTDQIQGLIMYTLPTPNSKQLLQIPNGEQVQVLSDTNGWAEIAYQSKQGYVHSGGIRYYSDFSSNEAKKVTDQIIELQRKTWEGNLTKEQLFSAMSPGFTTDYMTKYMNQQFRVSGTTKKGAPLYHIEETEIYGLSIDSFDWSGNDTSPPSIKHYSQNGQEYLVIAQFHQNEEIGDHLSTLYLSRSSEDAAWKVTDYITVY